MRQALVMLYLNNIFFGTDCHKNAFCSNAEQDCRTSLSLSHNYIEIIRRRSCDSGL
jgi:hypothetical protein